MITETTLPDGTIEKKLVEKTADGRVRVTTTRTVRVPSKKAQPVKRPEARERDKDDD